MQAKKTFSVTIPRRKLRIRHW